MEIDKPRVREHLKNSNFTALFIEELGWNNPESKAAIQVAALGAQWKLKPIAEKRGVYIYQCLPDDKGQIPPYATRQKIEKEVAKIAFEHLLIFTDQEKKQQIWQWVAREQGKPAAYREHAYFTHQSGDALLVKLTHIAFSLDEEEALTLAGAVFKLRDAFDREKLTKRFFERFQAEHKAFLAFIKGLERETDRQWYASLMLNRLMFVYFIQKKGFLDGDLDYLPNRLARVRENHGKGKFHNFYREFLLRLFHEGLGRRKEDRASDLENLLGNIPYLNGGLFEPHQLEGPDHDIHIPDEAFEKVFNFFDSYDWTLDIRPLKEGNEINPDVLGHIFEKYINQKQMGAYYTKEDITEYITKNTVIPWLFQKAQDKCPIAFERDRFVWSLLRNSPDLYAYPAMRHGTELSLPANIAAGIKSPDKREDWNKTASSDLGLPTETWREVIDRRARYEATKTKIEAGQIATIDDFITYNLDIRQFARDVIQYAEGPELVRAFWQSINGTPDGKHRPITVLDPACGSGAFLFAALNILYDLYDACLDRMEEFVRELESGDTQRGKKYEDFKAILHQIDQHPNRSYFIYKSIIINNLYGVDIMDEAVEICKLRLFLKLAAQLETAQQIEPLPDIDFNIRAGNTLVGFTSVKEVTEAIQGRGQGNLMFDDTLKKIEHRAEDLDKAFILFRQQQTKLGGSVVPENKRELRNRLKGLEDDLNLFLAREYGVDMTQKSPSLDVSKKFDDWKNSHKPFHWLIEFYGIMKDGGFDVIIGNPPYLELREVNYIPKGYETFESKAIHVYFIELATKIVKESVGGISMIVPLALVSTQRMQDAQRLIERNRITWYANYAWRPGKLFDTVNRALTIFISVHGTPKVYSTAYQKWNAESRPNLIQQVFYEQAPSKRDFFWVPKISNSLEKPLLAKFLKHKKAVSHYLGRSEHKIYYRTDGGLYWKVFTDFAPKFFINGKEGNSSRETTLSIADKKHILPLIAVLSSNTFWYWYTITSNLRHLNPTDIHCFPVPDGMLADAQLQKLGAQYVKDLVKNSKMLTREQKKTGTTQTQSFKIQKSKPIIDQIDQALAQHYGFTNEELDFIINYDIKYRMGADEDDEE